MRLIDYRGKFYFGNISNFIRKEPLRKEIIMYFSNIVPEQIRKIEFTINGYITLSVTEKELISMGKPHIKLCKYSNLVKIRFIDCAQITKEFLYNIEIIQLDSIKENFNKELYIYDILER